MKVLNLRCAHEHSFEGWFASEDDFQSQLTRGLLECPICADTTVTKMPSAPRLNVSGARGRDLERERERDGAESASPPAAPTAEQGAEVQTLQSVWLRAVQHVMANTVDVGEKFAEEARRMHYGEAEERAIRGQASREDAEALRDERIEVMTLPVPAALKGPLQ